MAATTYLVTGGAGFVGSSLALALREAHPGARVRALDSLKRRGSELALARLRRAGVDFVHGDVRCPEDLAHLPPADVLLDCAAEPSVLAGYGEGAEALVRTNLVGTLNALEYARRHRSAVLFLSTSRVYPHDALRELQLSETATRLQPAPDERRPGLSPEGLSEAFPLVGVRTLYGASKLASELLVAEYADLAALDAVVDRCGVIAGPWQMGRQDQGVVTLWVARHLAGRPLDYIGFGGAGKQVRDVLHVRDLCRLVLAQLDGLRACRGRTFNVGGGTRGAVSLLELTALCRDATGREIPIGAVEETRPGDVPWYVTDHRRVTEATGWTPAEDPASIVADTVDWLARHGKELADIVG